MSDAPQRDLQSGCPATYVLENLEESIGILETQGLLRINNVFSHSTADQLSAHLCEFLCSCLDQREKDPNTFISHFGTVQSLENRYDLKLTLDPPVKQFISETIGTLEKFLTELVTEDGRLCELSSLISDTGAAAQETHPDTPYQPCAPLYTVFAALQNISEDMGPTTIFPRTNNSQAHEAFRELKRQGQVGQPSEWERPILGTLSKGDVIIMDSRAFHYGGQNTSNTRRILAYFTLQVPGNTPQGSTYSLRDHYKHRFRLKNYKQWQDPYFVATSTVT